MSVSCFNWYKRCMAPRPQSNNNFSWPASTRMLGPNLVMTGRGLPVPSSVTLIDCAKLSALSRTANHTTSRAKFSPGRARLRFMYPPSLHIGCGLLRSISAFRLFRPIDRQDNHATQVRHVLYSLRFDPEFIAG